MPHLSLPVDATPVVPKPNPVLAVVAVPVVVPNPPKREGAAAVVLLVVPKPNGVAEKKNTRFMLIVVIDYNLHLTLYIALRFNVR